MTVSGRFFIKMKYFKYPIARGVTAITTTIEIGNMAFHLPDDPLLIEQRRKEVAKDLNVEPFNLIFTHQTHGDVIQEVTSRDIGKGSFSFEEGIEADALYTKEKRLAIGIFHADCVPIFIYDPTVPLVGIIHAGFPGTLKHIAFKAIKHVILHEGLSPENIRVYIGPARRKASYQLNQMQKEEVIYAGCPLFDDYFDMVESNKFDLLCAGIAQSNINDINVDTAQDPRCYSSYIKTPAGRMASLILLK